MNHALTYSKLIANAKIRVCVNGYVERHHILPKALGGSDDSSNIVALTAREHFIAHFLLAKMHGGSMWHAVTMMSKDRKMNSRLFEAARKQLSLKMLGNKMTFGSVASKETKDKMSVARRGKAGRVQSDATKQKLSVINSGKVLSEETRNKISISQKGLKKPDGHGAKISAFLIGKKRTEEVKNKVSESLLKYYAAKRLAKDVISAAKSPSTHGVKKLGYKRIANERVHAEGIA
tara:strand:- start:765 stop:1466 length:702 start_codon:yes stop_codon:yes gene_type:complete